MKIRQIRNATLRLDYAGTKFLIDPWLAPKDTYSGFTGTTNDHLRNPTSPLVVPMEEIVDVDAVLLTCHGIFPPFGIRVRSNRGTDYEAIKIQRRTDHRHSD